MSVRIPKYRHYKPTDQALVEIRGKRIYLGNYDSEECKQKYYRIVADLASGNHAVNLGEPQAELTVRRLILDYFRFAKTYYVKTSQPTDEIASLRGVLRRLRRLYGETAACQFGPRALKTLRETLIRERLSRKYINDSMSRVRRMFKWAVSNMLYSI